MERCGAHYGAIEEKWGDQEDANRQLARRLELGAEERREARHDEFATMLEKATSPSQPPYAVIVHSGSRVT